MLLQEKVRRINQSACGKVIYGIARKCKKYNVPVLVISGSLGEEINQLYSMGVSGMEASVCNIISLNNAHGQCREIFMLCSRESTSCT